MPAAGRRLRCGVQELRLADTGLAGHEQGSAIGPGRGEERADAVHLRLAPDQMNGLATVALPFVVLRGVDVDHGRYAWSLGALRVTADLAVSGCAS